MGREPFARIFYFGLVWSSCYYLEVHLVADSDQVQPPQLSDVSLTNSMGQPSSMEVIGVD